MRLREAPDWHCSIACRRGGRQLQVTHHVPAPDSWPVSAPVGEALTADLTHCARPFDGNVKPKAPNRRQWTGSACVFLGLMCLAIPGLPQSLGNQNLQSFDLVWQTVNDVHFDPAFGGVDWGKVRQRYRPQIESSTDVDEFIRVTNRMLFELQLSHLLVATEDMLKTYMPTLFAKGTAGLELRWIRNQAVIVRAKPGFPAHNAGLRAGHVIRQIGGRSVDHLVEQSEPLPPYNDRNRTGGIAHYLTGHLDGSPERPVTVTYLNENSQLTKAVLARHSRGSGRTVSDAMPRIFVEFEARLLDRHIGYIGRIF